MAKELEMENNKIGSAIQYFRETLQISQGVLCKGLCSVATLSRIEAGERDVDSLLLETLLERLGRTPNQFELILTEFDYVIYQMREEIKRLINDRKHQTAAVMLKEYEKIAASKGNVHMQFIINCRALLNELDGGSADTTIDLFMEAILYTVPDFKTNEINDYFLSNSELHIIIDLIQHMISAKMYGRAKDILEQILLYLDTHNFMVENYNLYPKVAVIASRFFMQNQDMKRALEMCNRGLEKNRGNRKMDYLGELSLIKAQTTEYLMKKQQYVADKNECLKLFLHAYYVFDFCEEDEKAQMIKNHLKEEYQWEDID